MSYAPVRLRRRLEFYTRETVGWVASGLGRGHKDWSGAWYWNETDCWRFDEVLSRKEATWEAQGDLFGGKGAGG